jgi:hypothetical protein
MARSSFTPFLDIDVLLQIVVCNGNASFGKIVVACAGVCDNNFLRVILLNLRQEMDALHRWTQRHSNSHEIAQHDLIPRDSIDGRHIWHMRYLVVMSKQVRQRSEVLVVDDNYVEATPNLYDPLIEVAELELFVEMIDGPQLTKSHQHFSDPLPAQSPISVYTG